VFDATVQFAMTRIDFRVAILTPFPGTPLHSGWTTRRILTRNWSSTTAATRLPPKLMTPRSCRGHEKRGAT